MKNVKRKALSAFFFLYLLLPAISRAQINYAQDFAAGNAGWAVSGYPANTINIMCGTPGALSIRVWSTVPSGSFTSPDLGGISNNGGNLTLSYNYKLVDYISNTFIKGTTGDMITLELQYASSSSGPWTTLQKIGTNHVPTINCTGKTITFSAGTAGSSLYLRFAATRQSASTDCNVIVDDISLTQGPAPAANCSGTPSVGATLASNLTVCSTTGGATELSLASLPENAGNMTYQWQLSADNNTYADIPGAANISWYADNVSADTWFRCMVTCTASGMSAPSAPLQVTAVPCSFAISRDEGQPFNSIKNTGTYVAPAAPLVPIGFPFTFMGNTYTNIQFSKTGSLSFAPNLGADPNAGIGFQNAINSANFSPSLLVPFWQAFLEVLEMRYKTEGTAPDRIFTAEWIGANYGTGNGVIQNLDLNFQVRLYEGSNKIEYIYGQMDGHKRKQTGISTYTYGRYQYSVGLRNSASNFISQKVHNSNYFVTTAPNDTLSVLPHCNSRITFLPAGVFSAGTAPPATPPVNDNSSGAIELAVNDGPCSSLCGNYFSSANATPSPEASTCSTAPDDDVWFKFTIPVTTNINIRVLGSDRYIPLVSLMDASFTALSGAGCVNMGNGNENINIPALPAGTYYIRVSQAAAGSGPEGEFAICVSRPPVNDECSGAVSLAVTQGFPTIPLYASLNGATPSATAPSGVSCSFSGKDVWYSAQVPLTGNLVVQLEGADAAASASDYQLQVITGDCTNPVSIACSGSGAQKIGVSGQTPGTILLFRVIGSASAPLNFWISTFDTTASVSLAIAAGGTCLPADRSVFIPNRHNLYRLTPIMDVNGNIVAEINPNGNRLGQLASNLNINTGSVRQAAVGYYMDRSFTITPEIQPTSLTVLLRLYYKQSELSAMESASGITGGSVRIYKNSDPCGNSMAVSPTMLTTVSGNYPGGKYAQVGVPSFSSFYLVNIAPLPVRLLSFKGKNEGNTNKLTWITAEEVAFSHFELQRAADGIHFQSLANVPSRGASGGTYSYIDLKPFDGANFYRLNMIDADGTSALSSEIVELNMKQGNGIMLSVYPNPVNALLNVDITGAISGSGTLQILDIMGKVVRTVNVAGAASQIDMSGIASGTYILHYRDNNNNIVMKISRK